MTCLELVTVGRCVKGSDGREGTCDIIGSEGGGC